jgi:hypothetical protein
MALGLVCLLGATFGAGGEESFERQLAWLNLAIVGSAVAAVAQAGWLLQGRRALRRSRRDVLGALASAAPVGVAPAPASAPTELVTVVGAVRLHRPTCVLVRGKVLSAAGSPGPRCEVCRP